MSADLAISVRGLGKDYTIAHNQVQHSTTAEALLHKLRNPFQRSETETFHALQDVNFEVEKGDVVGVIGRNGAGKSTLLKVLSRITEPTFGEVDLYGRVGSLLEVGTGFHAELTGRENIYLNGSILGMTRREIASQFDAIVDFSGVEQFLDTPVKRYSSGMYVRLAFAVAAHLRSEILIIDEVLAVGDAEFQKKCLGKMKDVAGSGRTVLFVSHQMQAVSALCSKSIFMQAGQVGFAGDVASGIDRYLNSKQVNEEANSILHRSGSGELRFTRFQTDRQNYLSADDVTLEMDITLYKPGQSTYFVSLEIVNGFGLPVLHLDSRLLNLEFDVAPIRTVIYRIGSTRLAQGNYVVNAYLCSSGGIIDRAERVAEFEIAPILPYPATRNDCADSTLFYPQLSIEHKEVTKSYSSPGEVESFSR